jgi:hypothetical protein
MPSGGQSTGENKLCLGVEMGKTREGNQTICVCVQYSQTTVTADAGFYRAAKHDNSADLLGRFQAWKAAFQWPQEPKVNRQNWDAGEADHSNTRDGRSDAPKTALLAANQHQKTPHKGSTPKEMCWVEGGPRAI